MTVIIFLIILSVLVIAHELGHFTAAKLFRVQVDEFGIGFPPKIMTLFRRGGTNFVLNWIPLGGYVNLAGENQNPDETADTDTNPALFYHKKAWQRFIVILAGPLVNILLAVIIFIIAYGVWGIPEKVPNKVFIDYLEEGSPAQEAGLPTGVAILQLGDQLGHTLQPHDLDQTIDFINARQGEEIIIYVSGPCQQGVCQQPAASYSAYVRTVEERPAGSGALGVALSQYQDFFYPWYQQIPLSIYHGCRQSYTMATDMLSGLIKMVTDLVHRQQQEVVVMGPVGIVSELHRQHTFQAGLMTTLSFAGLLSLNLGIINLLPIPALDGGRLVLILAEKIVGRQHIAKIELGLNYVGFIFVIGLSILITGHDIWRLLAGG